MGDFASNALKLLLGVAAVGYVAGEYIVPKFNEQSPVKSEYSQPAYDITEERLQTTAPKPAEKSTAELDEIIAKAEQAPAKQPESATLDVTADGFVDPNNYTGNTSDYGVDVTIGKIRVDTSQGYQQHATAIPVTIRVPGTPEDAGKEIFITYSLSEDAHYFIPDTGKVVTGKYNEDDGKVWYQTTLTAPGMELRGDPAASKTMKIPGHCNKIYAYGMSLEMASRLPGNYGLLDVDNFKHVYSSPSFPLVMNSEPILVCTDPSDKFSLDLRGKNQ
jgi:hypothetical protein